LKNKHTIILSLAALGFCLFCLSGKMIAQDLGESLKATEIRVEGAQRIEADTVRSYVAIKKGDIITPRLLDLSLKKLFETGLFADVLIKREGTVVIIRLLENPVINRIVFEGNKRIEEDSLRQEVRLKPRIVYTRARVKEDVKRLLEIYRRSGRFAASVEPKVVKLKQNRVDLIFEIDEGKLTKIRRISFIGNSIYDDSDLRSVIQTKESAWYRFITSDDNYDPDRLAFDRELLRRFYLNKGYADFRVISAIAELAPDRNGFFITFTLEEGRKYNFGRIVVSSEIDELKQFNLRKSVNISDGDIYNAESVEDGVAALTDLAGNKGYAFVNIRPLVKRSRKEKKIDVVFQIREGPKVYVERINIKGNVRTIDTVIRREIPLVEGDAFNASKLRRARKNIRALRFFSKVKIQKIRGSAADKTKLEVKVVEQSTGQISLGAGFSSSDGLLADIGIRERNLLGRAQDLALKFQISGSSSQIDLKFTEPYFLNRKLLAGFDVFRTTRDLGDESSLDRSSVGGALRVGYDISDKWSQKWKYKFSADEVKNISSTASLAVKQQKGDSSVSSINQVLTFDTRDDVMSPRTGTLSNFSSSFAGLGGSVQYIKNTIATTQYFSLSDSIVASFSLSGGYLMPIGDDARIIDRFFLGGRSLRGFEPAGVSPRDRVSGDAVGGEWYYTSSLRLQFPLGLPNEFGIKGRVFTDLGSTGKTDTSLGVIDDTNSIRGSVGFGLSWKSPLGPFTIDVATPYMKESYDRTESIRFGFFTGF